MESTVKKEQSQDDYGIGILIGMSLLAIFLSIAYTAISYLAKYDLLIFGFLFVVFLPLYFIVKFIVQKKRTNNLKKIIIYCTVALILGFCARLATRSFMVYNYQLIPDETSLEKQEGSYVSNSETLAKINDILKQQTGFEAYAGAFIWDLQHSEIITSSYGTDTVSEANFSESIIWWVVEFVAILFCVLIGLPLELKKLKVVCKNCGNYKTKIFFVVGKAQSFQKLKNAIKNKDFSVIKSLYKPDEAIQKDFVSIAVWTCKQCQGGVEVDLVLTKNSRTTQIPLRVGYSAEEFAMLKKSL